MVHLRSIAEPVVGAVYVPSSCRSIVSFWEYGLTNGASDIRLLGRGGNYNGAPADMQILKNEPFLMIWI